MRQEGGTGSPWFTPCVGIRRLSTTPVIVDLGCINDVDDDSGRADRRVASAVPPCRCGTDRPTPHHGAAPSPAGVWPMPRYALPPHVPERFSIYAPVGSASCILRATATSLSPVKPDVYVVQIQMRAASCDCTRAAASYNCQNPECRCCSRK